MNQGLVLTLYGNGMEGGIRKVEGKLLGYAEDEAILPHSEKSPFQSIGDLKTYLAAGHGCRP